ncbi:protein-ADP-ribose hydrolase [Ruoffia tabacinasalis]|uniref:Protein-ADP-ribose hydrolase n=1 Tax=Ruoffia tabacinasalis TaxID=87458 RepID=A0A5R9DW14_9LACT|nr:protein-ADP-ribose hydrolase [Ruoffia tabacinasalis]TLQ41428.1 protein-ADP-ribose hydrolase [Ruoffia tabacinasalis]
MKAIADLEWMVQYLSKEDDAPTLEESEDTFKKWRHLVNVRPPKAISEEYLEHEDHFLKANNNQEEAVTLEDLTPDEGDNIYLWKGDITTLAVDSIVNAANSELLGCFIPNHNCIDNIIHTKAGIRLRLACHEIITEQGKKEPVSKAKLTPAYHLPANYIIHTVGPTASGRVTRINQKLLTQTYQACLEMADRNQLESIAFCCISTGVFGFPNEPAAEIAIKTVRDYLSEHETDLKVIFNVYEDEDEAIYQKKLIKGDA